jgi:hypothetical protein
LTRPEWLNVVSLQKALWPHGRFPDDAMIVQYEFVAQVPYDAAVLAVKALATREHPPNAAMIARKAAELLDGDLPGWDEVRPTLVAMIRKGYDTTHPPDQAAWESNGYHPVLAAFFSPARWRQWCLTDEADTTFNAQQRVEYRLVTGRVDEELALLAAGVDRREIGRGPQRLDPARSLGLIEGGAA